jgi:hypothetical protein
LRLGVLVIRCLEQLDDLFDLFGVDGAQVLVDKRAGLVIARRLDLLGLRVRPIRSRTYVDIPQHQPNRVIGPRDDLALFELDDGL